MRHLSSYLTAGYPFLVLRTHEEDRALALLGERAHELGRALLTVSMTAELREDSNATPMSLVSRIAAKPDPALFVGLDLHPWLGEPLVVRALRDLRSRLEARSQTLVFLSPGFEVPADLAGEVVVLDLPLPGPEELRRILAGEAATTAPDLDPVLAARAVRAVQGLTGGAAARAFRRALGDAEGLPAGDVSGLVEEKRRLLRTSDLLELVETPPGLDEVGGLEALKVWLRDRESAFSEEARAFGLPLPKGLLLVGVQGCGKSLTAKSVAHVWDLPLARLDFAALFTAGRSPEESLRRTLRLAEALAPAVLWLDEMDKAFQSVSTKDGGSETLHRLFASFLTWLQEKTAPTFVVATANAVEHLPAELLRKGRFDEVFFVDLPETEERKQILSIHLRAHGREPAAFDLDALAAETARFSGAELEQVVLGGLYRAFRHRRDLETADLSATAKATVPLYRTYEDSIKQLREWASTRARKASGGEKLKELWGS